MIKTILICTCAVLSFGCTEKTSQKQSIEHKQALIYKNNILNSECESFLTKNIADYLACDSWKIKSANLNDILKFSEKYVKNFVSSHHLMEPTEIRLKKIIVKDSHAFVLYPNGFFVVAEKGKYDNESGYSEENQSYACLKVECEKYFLWKFVNETIMRNNPNFEEENPRADDIADHLMKKNINSQPDFILKNNEIDINGKTCHYKKLITDQPKECLYYIADDTLYVYIEKYHDEQSLVQKLKLQ